MFEWADSNWLRVVGYAVVAVLCFAGTWREDREAPGSWPPFWVLTGCVFAIAAIARAVDLADLVTDILRDQAVAEGWYQSRRRVQGVVVALLGLTWLLTVLIACWRVPARRRRYLPMIVVVLTIGAFAAIRAVSLHQVDSLLYRRDLAGVRFVAIVECGLLVVAGVCAVWTPRRSDRMRVTGRRHSAGEVLPSSS